MHFYATLFAPLDFRTACPDGVFAKVERLSAELTLKQARRRGREISCIPILFAAKPCRERNFFFAAQRRRLCSSAAPAGARTARGSSLGPAEAGAHRRGGSTPTASALQICPVATGKTK